jgi:type IV pilus assembly protein PilM
MALPFLNRQNKKRDQIIAVDLGGRVTKAVHVQQRNGALVLLRYAVMDAPAPQKTFSADILADHLKAVVAALDAKTKSVTIAISTGDSVVRQAEMPMMPLPDMRLILKMNPKAYLQQELPNHIFDCHIILPRQSARPDDKAKSTAGVPKLKVIVAGAKKQLVEDCQTAVKSSGLLAEQIMPGNIGPLNAFELAMPEQHKSGVFALVDIGFKSTTISIIQDGELILSRVMNIGGDKLTTGLAESMSISYAEAEGIKVGMPAEVQPVLEALLLPLGRELRASIDFFEHQHEQHVSHVYLSGGSARSEFVVKVLETEMMIPCKSWNPVGSMQTALPPQQTAELDQIAPQLTVAIGAATAFF